MSLLFKCVWLEPSTVQQAEYPSEIHNGEQGTAGFIKCHCRRAPVLTQEHLVGNTFLKPHRMEEKTVLCVSFRPPSSFVCLDLPRPVWSKGPERDTEFPGPFLRAEMLQGLPVTCSFGLCQEQLSHCPDQWATLVSLEHTHSCICLWSQ